MNNLKSIGEMSSEKETALWESLASGDDEAREELILMYRPLVFWIAKKFKISGSSYPDLIQEGMMALIKAVDCYDYTRGYRFTTYSYHRVRGQMINFLQRKEARAPVPVDFFEQDLADPFTPELLDSILDLKEGMASLPVREARIVSDLVMQGKSARDVANSESLDISHVYRLKRKALGLLRDWLFPDTTTEVH